MIKTYKMNYEESKKVYEECSDCIEMKNCYNNIFNVMFHNGEKFRSGEWKIAYGYYTAIDNLMARHCFIVANGSEVIDPTVFTQSKQDKERLYMSYKEFEDLEEYLDALDKDDRQPALYDYMRRIEMEVALPWAKENGFILMG